MPARSIAGSASAARWSGRDGAGLSRSALAAALDYIRRRPEIWEVILTGGDPLVLSPRRLKDVMTQLTAIDHVKVIRIHTRVPVAAPERISAAMVRALRTDKATFVVLHANHPRELGDDARGGDRAFRRCRHSGAVAVGAAARRQRRCRNARRADAGFGRVPDQTLLPAPRRPRAGHLAFSHHDCRRPRPDARAARPHLRPLPAALMCSIFPAGTANRRSAQIMSARTAVSSKTSMAGDTLIRRVDWCGGENSRRKKIQ